MLDNVIDISEPPSQRISKSAPMNRRIGLGIMGFADLLYALEIPYNSKEGFEMAEKVMKIIQEEAHLTSEKIAKEKGVFPNYHLSVYKDQKKIRANAALTNIAPTGTISMMFDVSGGLEPHFAVSYYRRNILGGKVQLRYFNKQLKKCLKKRGLYTQEIADKIAEFGSVQQIKEIPDDIKRVFVTAMDITADDHIQMQSRFQKYCDNSISKTINFPNAATVEDIYDGYVKAWSLGCKGCTVYRNGCRQVQVLNIGNEDNCDKDEVTTTYLSLDSDSASSSSSSSSSSSASVSRSDSPDNMSSSSLQSDSDDEDNQWVVTLKTHNTDLQFDDSFSNLHEVITHQQTLQTNHNKNQVKRNKRNPLRNSVNSVVHRQSPQKPCPDCGETEMFVKSENCLKCLNCSFSMCSV